jgi:hypothetical protein
MSDEQIWQHYQTDHTCNGGCEKCVAKPPDLLQLKVMRLEMQVANWRMCADLMARGIGSQYSYQWLGDAAILGISSINDVNRAMALYRELSDERE